MNLRKWLHNLLITLFLLREYYNRQIHILHYEIFATIKDLQLQKGHFSLQNEYLIASWLILELIKALLHLLSVYNMLQEQLQLDIYDY